MSDLWLRGSSDTGKQTTFYGRSPLAMYSNTSLLIHRIALCRHDKGIHEHQIALSIYQDQTILHIVHPYISIPHISISRFPGKTGPVDPDSPFMYIMRHVFNYQTRLSCPISCRALPPIYLLLQITHTIMIDKRQNIAHLYFGCIVYAMMMVIQAPSFSTHSQLNTKDLSNH